MRALFTFAILLTACGSAFLPQPTEREFTTSDILGKWSHANFYSVNSESTNYTVTVELSEDGSFHQEIHIEGETSPLTQTGRWKLKGANLELIEPLQEDYDSENRRRIWTAQSAYWWFVDSYGNDQPVALFGSLKADPDSFSVWNRETSH